jgi:hypothetical protein
VLPPSGQVIRLLDEQVTQGIVTNLKNTTVFVPADAIALGSRLYENVRTQPMDSCLREIFSTDKSNETLKYCTDHTLNISSGIIQQKQEHLVFILNLTNVPISIDCENITREVVADATLVEISGCFIWSNGRNLISNHKTRLLYGGIIQNPSFNKIPETT